MTGLLIFKIVVLSLGVLNSGLLIVKGNRGKIKSCFLGWSLFSYSIFFLVFVLWYEAGLILSYPHLLRSTSPLMFMAGPFFYFFVRNTLDRQETFKKSDWLHFIPALIHSVDLLPIYLMSSEEKLLLAQRILAHPYQLDVLASGFIDSFWVNSLRLLQVTTYFTVGIWLLVKNKKLHYGPTWIKNWLAVAVVLIGGINLGYFGFRVTFFVGFWNGVDLSSLQIYFSYLILFCVGVLSLYIHVNPEWVFAESSKEDKDLTKDHTKTLKRNGAPSQDPNSNGEKVIDEEFCFEPNEKICSELVHLFNSEEIYREKGLLVTDISKRLGVSVRELPHYFRYLFDSDFKNYVNEKRVDLAKERIEEGYLDQYTLEALGDYCGFSSRTTFFNAFKKKYGKSPGEFWKAFQEIGK